MNTRLAGPVELPGSYNAAVERERQAVAQSGTANGDVYRQAQAVCEKDSIPLTARAQCIQEYVISNAVPGTNVEELQFPNKALYSYNFSSPVLSLDIAGVFTIGALFFSAWLAVLLLHQYVLPRIRKSVDDDPLE